METNIITHGDCIEEMANLPDDSINLIVTSPPYADTVSYGKKVKTFRTEDFIDWFTDFGKQAKRILAPDGSFILNIGNKTENRGKLKAQRSLYIMKTVIALTEKSELAFHDEYIWYKLSCLPSSSKRRLNNIIEYIFHFTKKANSHKCYMDRIREPYAPSSLNRMQYDNLGFNKEVSEEGLATIPRKAIKSNPLGKIPGNVFRFQTAGVSRRSVEHPAPFNQELPDYFVKWLTDEGDIVLDPFMGSGTTALSAWESGRKYIGYDINKIYVDKVNELMKHKTQIEF